MGIYRRMKEGGDVTRAELLKKADSLPLQPGVYLMMDKTGKVIYVGKAKKLKNRVSQYFQAGRGHNDKTRAMVNAVDHFDTIFVSSEFEALILENSLIKRHQPYYNILLKDDKGYPFVRLDDKSDYPRFTLVSKSAEDGCRYFGPFGGRQETRAAIDAVCAALHLPTCARRFPRDIGKERPCLNHHIGKCDGFCRPDGPDAAEYRRRIAQAERLFSGKLRQLTGELQQEMTEAAEALQFEKAAALRDRIRALELLVKQQQVIAGRCTDTDVWGFYTEGARPAIAVLHVEDGDLLSREVQVFSFSAEEEAGETLGAALRQYYLGRDLLPREILVPLLWEDSDVFAALLSEQCGHKVTLRLPQRGEKAELLSLAERNAREEAERVTSEAERISKTLRELGELAGLEAPPRRLEAYDISNTGKDDMVASMVVFTDGKPLKRDYRHFKIRSLEHPDDYAAMQEVLTRRFQRLLDGDKGFAERPDLLLIDGGETHARAVRQALAALGIFDVPILGMVKDDRHRTRALMTPDGQELGIRQSPPLFALIGRIQEEVHRFAVTFHHKTHTKRITHSALDDVPGIGEKRKAALLKHFGTLRAIKAADEADLAAAIGPAAARSVYEHFHTAE